MATPHSTYFAEHDRTNTRVPTLGEFILTKRIRRGKKANLGIKKLISRLEHKLATGSHVPGSILAAPSAPSYEEGDSDCDSWGSDFDDDENEVNFTCDVQEEVENDINDMLEAAMERNRSLENSRFASNEASERFPATSDAPRLPPNRLDLPRRPQAPPLPRRNPELGPSMSAGNSGSSAANVRPCENVSNAKQPPPLVPSDKTPVGAIPKNNAARVAISPTTSTSRVPLPSPPAAFSAAHGTPDVATSIVAPAPSNSSNVNRTFPLDVTFTSSAVTEVTGLPSRTLSPSFTQEEINSTAVNTKSSTSNAANAFGQTSQVISSHIVKVVQPNSLRETLSGPQQSTAMSVPPPLPSRPPPVTRFLSNTRINNNISITTGAASVLKDDAKFQNSPRLALVSSVATSQINKNSSSPQPNLAKKSLQNSPPLVSAKPVINSTKLSSKSPCSSELQQTSSPKNKATAFPVPKFIKELDAAVLKQVIPKTSRKSTSVDEMQQRDINSRSRSHTENIKKPEAEASSPTEEYLNPKEASDAGPMQFTPDRPTLPRRLKKSRSLPLVNIVDNLMRDTTKNKVSADEKGHQKLHLQPSQAINETPESGPELPAPNDEVFRQPWYHPVTWTQAQFKLTAMGQDGTFLVRPSSRISQGVPYTVSVCFRGQIINCHICCTADRKYVLGKPKPNQKTFDTVMELIRHHQSTPAEMKISEIGPATKVCFLITPPKDNDRIYAD